MRTRRSVVTLSALLGCSSPYRAPALDAAQPGVGGLGSGGSMVSAGGTGDSGTIGGGGRGGTGGASGTHGNGGTGSPEAGSTGPTDATTGTPDAPIVAPDADEDGVASTDAGGGSAAEVADGGAMAGDSGDATTRPTLRKFVGNISEGGSAIRSDFLQYWDQLSIGPEGQYAAVRSGDMQYDWSKLDPLYDFSRKNHIPIHEYAFIFGVEEPRYFADNNAARAGIEDWIRSFCARYPDTEFINVVYEPLHTVPYYKEALGGAGTSGYDWIVQALVWARTHCPNSILLVTDYNTIEYPAENQNMIKLVSALLAAGAPIDAIGAEAVDAARVPLSTVKGYLDRLAALGLPIYITTYGIGEEDDAKQEALMRERFPVFWTDDRIKGITFWGYVVGSTWRSGLGLVQPDGTPRPAMTWLMSYLGR